jgi:hypothetical protein
MYGNLLGGKMFRVADSDVSSSRWSIGVPTGTGGPRHGLFPIGT